MKTTENALDEGSDDVFLDALDEESNDIYPSEKILKVNSGDALGPDDEEEYIDALDKEIKQSDYTQTYRQIAPEVNDESEYAEDTYSQIASEFMQEYFLPDINNISGPLKSIAYVGAGAAIGTSSILILCSSGTAMTTIGTIFGVKGVMAVSLVGGGLGGGAAGVIVGAIKDPDVKATLGPLIKDIGIERSINHLSKLKNPGEVLLYAAKKIISETVNGSIAGAINDGPRGAVIAGAYSFVASLDSSEVMAANGDEKFLSENTAILSTFIDNKNKATALATLAGHSSAVSYLIGLTATINNLMTKKNGLKILLNWLIPDRATAGVAIVVAGLSISTFVAANNSSSVLI